METVTLKLENYLLLKDKEKALNELLQDKDSVIIMIYNDRGHKYFFRKTNEVIKEMNEEIDYLKKLNYDAKEKIICQSKYIDKIRKNKILKYFLHKTIKPCTTQ